MPLFDFQCPSGHVTERILHHVRATWCECGLPAYRIYTRPPAVTHPEPDTRGMYRRFTEASAELGDSGPSLWPAAKQRAEAISRAGENPSRRS